MTEPQSRPRGAASTSSTEPRADSSKDPDRPHNAAGAEEDESNGDDQDEEGEASSSSLDSDEDDDDDEPHLKYARLTQHLGAVYRNADATSAFMVAGDKMIIGTHNGNIHVIQLPTFQTLKYYHAHSASVTSVSISPNPPPLPSLRPEAAAKAIAQASPNAKRPDSKQSSTPSTAAATTTSPRRPREQPSIPNIPSNNIHIATSSLDGNICVQSLLDYKDVQLRNFARPVQAVALSPDYKNDRTYLSGGLAGNLIVTTGGTSGRSTSTTVGTAAATASGWLGSVGLSSNTGKDVVLHSGEGPITAIKWSRSGKYVAWLNEHGIKIMRSTIRLDSADNDDAWKRIGHVDRPQTNEWDIMANVWKGRLEWVDEDAFENEETDASAEDELLSPATKGLHTQKQTGSKQLEKLLVGWGGIIWIIHVHPGGGANPTRHGHEKSLGRAEVVKILRLDCIISGLAMYTPSLLLVLAYVLPEDDEEHDADQKQVRGHQSKPSDASTKSEPSGGIRRRQNNQPPELRLIDLQSQAEIDKDGLSISRYERLSASDYHLAVLPQNAASAAIASRGAMEALAGFGTDVWNAAINPKSLFSSGASIRSGDSGDAGSRAPSFRAPQSVAQTVHPNLAKPGVKIFMQSPYDCILATKRDLGDHLQWLVEREEYETAWELVDEHPEIVSLSTGSDANRLQQTQSSSDGFYEDNASTSDAPSHLVSAAAQNEKRRIGQRWLQQLVSDNEWTKAGQIAGRVVDVGDLWEKWVATFAAADKLDVIVNYIPTEQLRPRISSEVYDNSLKYYIDKDKPRFRDLLERWNTDLFDATAISEVLENQLKYRDVREDSIEDGQIGRDWRIVMESLAKLYEASGRHREALRCFIKLHDPDAAMRLIKENHLADAVSDDIPAFVMLRVDRGRAKSMSVGELEAATSESITLLVDEAQHGLVRPEVVVSQLEEHGLTLYLYFYLRALFRGQGIEDHQGDDNNKERLVMDSKSIVDNFADLAVELFAKYDQTILGDFLRTSTSYNFERAVHECETHNFIPELVYLFSITGQTKRALFLIIDNLQDVDRAISFAKDLDDPDLWEDLLNYSMDKPRFIRGLLEGVGTAIDPVTLIRRIPEGLEVEGLPEGLKHIMKEHEIQYSISEGVARVLRSEVSAAQAILRNGQRKGLKFDVAVKHDEHVDLKAGAVKTPKPAGVDAKAVANITAEVEAENTELVDATAPANGTINGSAATKQSKDTREPKPGHCAACHEPFTEWDAETLVGFACRHVFHLSHLLKMLHPDEEVPDDIISFGAEHEDDGFDPASRRRVGTKVTHARLLRDRIRGGCPICVHDDDLSQ